MDPAFDSFLSFIRDNKQFEASRSADWLKYRDHAFCVICAEGELETVQWFLNMGADPTYMKNAPLWKACENGHTAIVILLLTYKAVVASAHAHRNRCLFAAQREEYEDIETLLLTIPAVADGPSMKKWGYGLLD